MKNDSYAGVIKENHPNIPKEMGGPVYYIPQGFDISKLESKVLRRIDSRTQEFFFNYKDILNDFSKSINSKYISSWISGLIQKKMLLVVIIKGKTTLRDMNGQFDSGGSYIIFQNENPEWIHSGAALDFEYKLHNPANYHPAIFEILRFCNFHFSYWYAGAKLYGLGRKNIAIKEDLIIKDFLTEINDSTIPINDLRIIYEDYSGSCIMHDKSFNIWCGGFDEGNLWKTNQTVETLMDSIFCAHQAKEFPTISEISNGTYL